jgi:vacuolar-type H+-ATPase subunit H
MRQAKEVFERQVRGVVHDAMHEAKSVAEDATREARETARDAMRQAREAGGRGRGGGDAG